ncbi:MAG: 6-bladed beta-propeller [Bacteroidetes bacterium]|nr:6-bladed beta-propeller [Bacteroidota bacterium]
MRRRQFLRSAATLTAGFHIASDLMARPKGPAYGHNGIRFTLDMKWSQADPLRNPVNDCHEMVQDARGNIYLLTNETKNNILVFNRSGKLLRTWGNDFPGGHGLTLADENGTQYLFITDTSKHQVYKATLDGRILLTIDPPLGVGLYQEAKEFVPTETTVTDTGDIFIADGYGKQYVLHYDPKGRLKGYFGGRGEGDAYLDNAHGICMDHRGGSPTLLVTDRTRNCFKRFSLSGQLQDIIRIPGACVCRPVIKGDYIYAAVLRSPVISQEKSGFVTILDKNNRVVSNIGGTEPIYEGGQLKPLAQAEKILVHPHDVMVDRNGDLYVAQWASGKVYPYKFKRVS